MATAFLFPGQGSQSVGMLAGLADDFPQVKATFAEASDALGFDLWALCQDGPEADLNRTENTQPAMLAGDIATWRAWREAGGPVPEFMAGHSLGEYAALVAAGVLDFADAARLVALRGRLMQAATPEGVGAMAAIIGLDDAVLEKICAGINGDEIVSCANYNAPGQVVIAGHRGAVDKACEAASEAGARRALPLPVSVPSHCALMRDAADELGEALAQITINAPAVPVYHNVDVATHDSADEIVEALARQLWQPVRWTATINALGSAGATRFVECGAGKVLAGLNRRINRDAAVTALGSRADIEQLIGELQA
ncbi:ACP S-malonyltransferase [Marinihelvus fidelis]|uniref:Malonyl CoA-acyl carrier protein transacylase n=1 Tax=Marinihelvus fidelis TaxID=2613842 RepID=A0A5N0TAH9_9GAMM|nr:ACP S-malonyltransferase [Marinihelvus fidelis]KAA9132015.1 ACP S-malonyltransferase [Marinihelvus fidelis]